MSFIRETQLDGSVALDQTSNLISLLPFFILFLLAQDMINMPLTDTKSKQLFLFVFPLSETDPTCSTLTFSNVPHLLMSLQLLSMVFSVQPHR